MSLRIFRGVSSGLTGRWSATGPLRRPDRDIVNTKKPEHWPVEEQLAGKTLDKTQFGHGAELLGCELISAGSPQAAGWETCRISGQRENRFQSVLHKQYHEVKFPSLANKDKKSHLFKVIKRPIYNSSFASAKVPELTGSEYAGIIVKGSKFAIICSKLFTIKEEINSNEYNVAIG
ncbi:MAG: hypothetical protein LBE02_06050 [Spirochaetaceae bacterium]|nr:hypothetical protein [Spirochaetaceae bacterium]